MIGKRKVLALIPARGGSKRLPGKNIKPLAGVPLIGWSIKAALDSRYVDRVLVSTDDAAIAEVARTQGADVPFLRPPELASDTAGSAEVIEHALDFLADKGDHYDLLMLLQPTSPLRDAVEVDRALESLVARQGDAVVSVCECEHPPEWSNHLPPNHSLVGFLREESPHRRSQDLGPSYRLNGAIYLCDTLRFRQERTLFLSDNIFAYVMPQEKSVDIDRELDFRIAEALLSMQDRLGEG